MEQTDTAVLPIKVPGATDADMLVERVRAVLGQNTDRGEARVDAVGEREVDDPVLATERHHQLRALARQDTETLALPAGQDHHHDSFHGRFPYWRSPPLERVTRTAAFTPPRTGTIRRETLERQGFFQDEWRCNDGANAVR